MGASLVLAFGTFYLAINQRLAKTLIVNGLILAAVVLSPVGGPVPVCPCFIRWRGAARAGLLPERAGHVPVRHRHRLVLHGHLDHRGPMPAARDRHAGRQDRLGAEVSYHGRHHADSRLGDLERGHLRDDLERVGPARARGGLIR